MQENCNRPSIFFCVEKNQRQATVVAAEKDLKLNSISRIYYYDYFLNDYAFTFKFECFIVSQQRVMHLFLSRQGNPNCIVIVFELCKYSTNKSMFEIRENG